MLANLVKSNLWIIFVVNLDKIKISYEMSNRKKFFKKRFFLSE
jgi:hypothetical protein